MQVVFLHGWGHLGLPTEGTQWLLHAVGMFPGVPIFFVVSGFLISASFERSPSTWEYLRNRFLRIYPALWVCFLVSLVTVAIFSDARTSWRSFTVWTFGQLTIGQFYNPDFLRGYGVGVLNGSLWTVTVELQFYLLLPFLYLAFQRIGWNRVCVGLCFLLFVGISQYYAWLADWGEESIGVKLLGVTALPHFYLFFGGVLLQRHRGFVARALKGQVLYWCLGYLFLGITLRAIGLPVAGNRLNPLSALFLGFVVISCAYTYADRLGRLLNGLDISYGVYLYHMVVFNVLVSVGAIRSFSMFAVGIAATVLLGLLSWVFVEKPALSCKAYSVKRQ